VGVAGSLRVSAVQQFSKQGRQQASNAAHQRVSQLESEPKEADRPIEMHAKAGSETRLFRISYMK
jgi:hypothetical protein